MKDLSPKKLIAILAVLCIVLSLITTNNAATIMVLLGSSGTTGSSSVATQQTANNNNGQQSGVVVDNSNNGGSYVDNGSTDNGNTAAPADNNGGASTDNGNTATPADNNGGTSADSGKTDAGKTDAGKTDAGKTDGGKTTGSLSTVADVVNYYNKAMNTAKSSAKTVTLVKDGALNYQNIFEAGALSSLAEPLRSFFKVEEKNETIDKGELPPTGVQCAINPNNVQSATAKEANGVYTIEILMKTAENPKSGDGGVGSAVNIIQESEITGGVSSIPGITLSNIKLVYENVKIVATVDKATGRLTAVSTDAPSILSLDAKVLVKSINGARVGIEVVSEYKIAY